MPALPQPLASVFAQGAERLPKRERTRRQLMQAAIQVFSARGVQGASIQEIATVAGMANGTVYNHFATKDDIVQAVAVTLAETLCLQIDQSYEHVKDGAERMCIGMRRYLWLARESPQWALLILGVSAASPDLSDQVRQYSMADLRLGIKQKRFRVASEESGLDVVFGTNTLAMTKVAMGLVPKPEDYCAALVSNVLCGLGVSQQDAAELVRRPLPPFTVPGTEAPAVRPKPSSPVVVPAVARAARARPGARKT
jgi:AcrR family transcriptional regulator